MIKKVIVCLFVGLLVIAVVAGLGALFFMMGWNFFFSPVFSLPIISFWQAFCAMLIIGIVGGAFKTSIGSKE